MRLGSRYSHSGGCGCAANNAGNKNSCDQRKVTGVVRHGDEVIITYDDCTFTRAPLNVVDLKCDQTTKPTKPTEEGETVAECDKCVTDVTLEGDTLKVSKKDGNALFTITHPQPQNTGVQSVTVRGTTLVVTDAAGVHEYVLPQGNGVAQPVSARDILEEIRDDAELKEMLIAMLRGEDVADIATGDTLGYLLPVQPKPTINQV